MGTEQRVYSVAWHSGKNVLISGHEDCSVRLWDPRVESGPQQSWMAHQDVVTSVAVQEDGASVFASASHDGNVRLWSMEQRSCVQELGGQHRFKNDESVHCVAFHQTGMPLMASCGADGVGKVYETLSARV
ncbi:Striatin-4 [Cichlidogyrus casuarinus]|uniref:Striatin-4 n=1 Tax=Cichlidogyrus casuarinus TaxID=1844966 RepID=A0ABD2PWN6_9PLAT